MALEGVFILERHLVIVMTALTCIATEWGSCNASFRSLKKKGGIMHICCGGSLRPLHKTLSGQWVHPCVLGYSLDFSQW